MNGEAVLDLLVGSFLFLQRMSALTLPHNHLISATFHEQLSQLPSKTSPFYINDVTFAVMSSDSSSAQLPLHCFVQVVLSVSWATQQCGTGDQSFVQQH